jgi:nucleotide-binding universal stress UspA family protein
MSFKNILLPTDGSEYTKHAIHKAIELAVLSGGKITALFVLDKAVYANSSANGAANVYDVLEEEGKRATSYVLEKAKEAGVEVTEKQIDGTPSTAILQESDTGQYDIIVMGSLGRTGISKLLMGSVAEKIVRSANCPVMVVKTPAPPKE